jgi:hypothetical protein
MVVGARTGKKVSIPLLRRPVKSMLNAYASFLAGKPVPDLNSGLRIFHKSIAQQYWKLFPERFSFTSTLTMCCLTNGHRTFFKPINYYKRVGSSTIHPIKDTIRFLELLTKLSLYYNPLRIFIPLALLFFVAAILRTIRDVMVVNHIGGLAQILFFLALQLFFFALLAAIVGKR